MPEIDLTIIIKNYVEEECRKPTSKYGYEPFPNHFVPMVRYAEQLAEEMGANREVVSIAAWLHDIGSIVSGRKDHHITGPQIAGEKLRELGYPEEKVSLVLRCIQNHRGSQINHRESLEEKIIADADAMSNFENLPGIFKAAFVYENLDQEQARIAVRQKLENKWGKLHFQQSKEIIRPKYEAVMLLL